MSVNSILSAGLSPAQSAIQSAKNGGSSNSDWIASLASALGGGAAAGGTASGTLTDQMQALLTQLQAGNTVAPSGASAAAGSDAASTAGQGATGHPHHHHHSGGSGIFGTSGASGGSGSGDAAGGSVLQDIATSLVGNTASASGSGSETMFGNTSGGNNLLTGLNSVGGTALSGVKQALSAYAALHGVQMGQTGTTN